MAYQSKTYSLSDEVIAWLGELKDSYGSVNKGLRAAMALCNDGSGAVPEPRERGSEAASAPLDRDIWQERQPPDAIPGVKVGASNLEKGFRVRCRHTGCQGAYFQAGSRFDSLCPTCREKGHAGDPRNCTICYEDGSPA